MVRNSGKRERNGEGIGSEKKGKLENDVDTLFKLPLAEFIGVRNTLAARLKQGGRANDANLVKTLAKPSISAWAVNQLYWKHREAFDSLLAAGERFRQAQRSGLARKVADMRASLDARREALSHLSDLATSLLRDAGHNPTSDTMRRITTTLEAISAHAALSDGPTPGRLTHDVDPPGFESLASLIPGTTEGAQKPARVTASKKLAAAATNTRQKAKPTPDVRQLEATRQARIAAARVSLQAAKRSLIDARARAQRLQAAQKKAYARAKEAEKQRREADERFKQASAASEEAAQRARSIADEVEEAAKAVEDAKLTISKASKELESLFRESPAM
jgi:hypothetical protein